MGSVLKLYLANISRPLSQQNIGLGQLRKKTTKPKKESQVDLST